MNKNHDLLTPRMSLNPALSFYVRRVSSPMEENERFSFRIKRRAVFTLITLN